MQQPTPPRLGEVRGVGWPSDADIDLDAMFTGGGKEYWADFWAKHPDLKEIAYTQQRRLLDAAALRYPIENGSWRRVMTKERRAALFRAAMGKYTDAFSEDPIVRRIIMDTLPAETIVAQFMYPRVVDAYKRGGGNMNPYALKALRDATFSQFAYRTEQDGNRIVNNLYIRPGAAIQTGKEVTVSEELAPPQAFFPLGVLQDYRLVTDIGIQGVLDRVADSERALGFMRSAAAGGLPREVTEESELAGAGRKEEEEDQRLFAEFFGSPMTDEERGALDRFTKSLEPGADLLGEGITYKPEESMPLRVGRWLYHRGLLKEQALNRFRDDALGDLITDFIYRTDMTPEVRARMIKNSDDYGDWLGGQLARFPDLFSIGPQLVVANYLGKQAQKETEGAVSQAVSDAALDEIIRSEWANKSATNETWGRSSRLQSISAGDLADLRAKLKSQLMQEAYHAAGQGGFAAVGVFNFQPDPNSVNPDMLRLRVRGLIDQEYAGLEEQIGAAQEAVDVLVREDLLEGAKAGESYDLLQRVATETGQDIGTVLQQAQLGLEGADKQNVDALTAAALNVALEMADVGLRAEVTAEQATRKAAVEAVGEAQVEEALGGVIGWRELEQVAQAIGQKASDLLAPFADEMKSGALKPSEAIARAVEEAVRLNQLTDEEQVGLAGTIRQAAQQFQTALIQTQGEDRFAALQRVTRLTGGDTQRFMEQAFINLGDGATNAALVDEALRMAAEPLSPKQRVDIIGGAGAVRAALFQLGEEATRARGRLGFEDVAEAYQIGAQEQLGQTFEGILQSLTEARQTKPEGLIQVGGQNVALGQAREEDIVSEALKRAQTIEQQRASEAGIAVELGGFEARRLAILAQQEQRGKRAPIAVRVRRFTP